MYKMYKYAYVCMLKCKGRAGLPHGTDPRSQDSHHNSNSIVLQERSALPTSELKAPAVVGPALCMLILATKGSAPNVISAKSLASGPKEVCALVH